jgi:O-antigen ligase
MFMTGSRAGSLASLFGLAMAFLAYFARTLSSRSSFLVAAICAVAFAGILIQTLGGTVSDRVDVEGLSDEGRLQTYRSTLRLIGDVPWLGTGLGTFAWVFPAYRSAEISSSGVWDRVHNTVLELAVEVGVPMTLLLCAGWLLFFSRLLRGVAIRRQNIALPAAAMAILAIATTHSMVDFSLQIPGFSIIVFAIVGVGLAQSARSNSRSGEMPHSNR